MINFFLIHRRKELVQDPVSYWLVPVVKEINRIFLNVIEDSLQTLRFEIEDENMPFLIRIPDIVFEAYDVNGSLLNVINNFKEESDLLILEIHDENQGVLHSLIIKEIKKTLDPKYRITAVGGTELFGYLKSEPLFLQWEGEFNFYNFISNQITSSENLQIFLYKPSVKVIGFDEPIIKTKKLKEILEKEENKNKDINKFDFIMFLAKQFNAIVFIDKDFYFVRRDLWVRDMDLGLEPLLVDGEISLIYNRAYDALMTRRVFREEQKLASGAILTSFIETWVIFWADGKVLTINAWDNKEMEQLNELKRKYRILSLWDIDLDAMEINEVIRNIRFMFIGNKNIDMKLYFGDTLFLLQKHKIAEVEVWGVDFNVMDKVWFEGERWNILRVEKDFVLNTSKLLLYSTGEQSWAAL